MNDHVFSENNEKIESVMSEREQGIAALAEWGLRVGGEKPDAVAAHLIEGSQESAEKFEVQPGRAAFGSMPFFGNRDAILARFAEEKAFFEQEVDMKAFPEWKRKFYAAGALAYELKFGKPLSSLVESILVHYPPKKDTKPGKKISLCGLSGSGKSTALEAVREVLGSDAVVMDSDTTRFNLFAADVQVAESKGGASPEQVQDRIQNSAISGSMYLALEYVTNALRKLGYDVVIAGTSPSEGSDKVLYVEHRTIDPRVIGVSGNEDKDKAEVAVAARQLFEVTEKRVPGSDSYDWSQAEQITRFEDMRDVSVRVPEFVHGKFVGNLKKELATRSGIISIKNPENSDAAARKQVIVDQLREVL